MLTHKLKIKNYVYKILTIIIKFALKTTKAVFIMSYCPALNNLSVTVKIRLADSSEIGLPCSHP